MSHFLPALRELLKKLLDLLLGTNAPGSSLKLHKLKLPKRNHWK